jgi:hypothetical protein
MLSTGATRFSGKSFSDLPPEIVIKIFQFLPQSDLLKTVPYVSNQFRILSKDHNLSIR